MRAAAQDAEADAHDRSDGGLFVTLAEMAFAGRTGVDIKLDGLAEDSSQFARELFNEELGAVVQRGDEGAGLQVQLRQATHLQPQVVQGGFKLDTRHLPVQIS